MEPPTSQLDSLSLTTDAPALRARKSTSRLTVRRQEPSPAPPPLPVPVSLPPPSSYSPVPPPPSSAYAASASEGYETDPDRSYESSQNFPPSFIQSAAYHSPNSTVRSTQASTYPSAFDAFAQQGYPPPGLDEDVIPTAIVVKNIPFSVKREQLLQIFEDLQIPAPYAFNYHFDNGIFRGLAFANFRNPSETDQAVAGLNGFDVAGRKLRVEYKKVLQAGEKERIEREKAIKRMRSVQLEKERERHARGDFGPAPALPGVYGAGGQGQGGQEEYEDYGRVIQGQFSGAGTGAYTPSGSMRGPPPGFGPSPPGFGASGGLTPGSENGYGGQLGVPGQGQHARDGSVASSGDKKNELDLNDAQTLEIYSRVLIFKDDSLRDELAFSRTLSATQRRVVHLVAKKLGLEHRSVGVGEERHVVVHKGGPTSSSSPGPNLRHAASNGMLGDAGGLRGKKSMPDIRGGAYGAPGQDSPSRGGGGGLYPPGSLPARKSNSNLRQGYATVGRAPSGRGGDLSNLFNPPPPVPALPQQHYGFGNGNGNGNGAEEGVGGAVRQPRGPDVNGGRNFAGRGARTGSEADGENAQTHVPLEF